MSNDNIEYTPKTTKRQRNFHYRNIGYREARIALIQKGLTVRELAERYNVSKWMIYLMFRNLAKSARIQQLLARDLGEGIFLD